MSLISLFAEAAGEAHGGEAGSAFPPFETWHFPSQLFWLAITFGGLYAILNWMILPRVSANLERRSDTIADDLDEAARLNEQAEEAKQALELNLAQARTKARETAAKTDADIAEEIAAETRKTDAQLDKKLEAAETRIADLRADALKNVEAVAADATQAIVARLGKSVKPAEAKRAVAAVLQDKGANG
ncbi:MAG: hypothetical protein AAGK23_11265 [Pseudomonadota bacterium]